MELANLAKELMDMFGGMFQLMELGILLMQAQRVVYSISAHGH